MEDWTHPRLTEEEFEERMQLFLDKIDRDTAIHGMSVIAIPRENDEPPFAYTVGLWSHGHPELLIVGLAMRQAHEILTSAKAAIDNGLIIEDGTESHEVVRDYPVRFKEVPYPRRPLNVARRFHHSDNFPAYQLIWTDPEGRYPDEEGYSDEATQELPTDEE